MEKLENLLAGERIQECVENIKHVHWVGHANTDTELTLKFCDAIEKLREHTSLHSVGVVGTIILACEPELPTTHGVMTHNLVADVLGRIGPQLSLEDGGDTIGAGEVAARGNGDDTHHGITEYLWERKLLFLVLGKQHGPTTGKRGLNCRPNLLDILGVDQADIFGYRFNLFFPSHGDTSSHNDGAGLILGVQLPHPAQNLMFSWGLDRTHVHYEGVSLLHGVCDLMACLS